MQRKLLFVDDAALPLKKKKKSASFGEKRATGKWLLENLREKIVESKLFSRPLWLIT